MSADVNNDFCVLLFVLHAYMHSPFYSQISMHGHITAKRKADQSSISNFCSFEKKPKSRFLSFCLEQHNKEEETKKSFVESV
jgi:hypothetical protein